MLDPIMLAAAGPPLPVPIAAPVAVTLLLLIAACAFVLWRLIGRFPAVPDDEGRQ